MVAKKTIKVLIVDDEFMIRQLLKGIFNESIFEVVGEATNADDALAQCKKLKPNVVCLDIVMPKVDGLTALKMIREEHPQIAVVMISGDASSENVQQAMSSGAAGFLVKPLNAQIVLNNMKQALINYQKNKSSSPQS